jgi:hypothetical protein
MSDTQRATSILEQLALEGPRAQLDEMIVDAGHIRSV